MLLVQGLALFYSKMVILLLLLASHLAREIKASIEKIDTILNMEPLNSRKLAQRLARRLAALNRIISRSVEQGLPFFELLKNIDPYS